MLRKTIALSIFLLVIASTLLAQDCKLKFAVMYTDGKALQLGLTEQQKKFWTQDGPKKFKGMCLDAAKPDFIVLWSVGLTGSELAAGEVANFNRGRATGENTTSAASNIGPEKGSTTDSRWVDSTVFIRPTGEVKEKANYWILDTSKTPYAMIRKGEGYQDVPAGMGHTNQTGQKASSADLSSTIPDPTLALENALKWLKKDKKL